MIRCNIGTLSNIGSKTIQRNVRSDCWRAVPNIILNLSRLRLLDVNKIINP